MLTACERLERIDCTHTGSRVQSRAARAYHGSGTSHTTIQRDRQHLSTSLSDDPAEVDDLNPRAVDLKNPTRIRHPAGVQAVADLKRRSANLSTLPHLAR
jgi:hypothetical protein